MSDFVVRVHIHPRRARSARRGRRGGIPRRAGFQEPMRLKEITVGSRVARGLEFEDGALALCALRQRRHVVPVATRVGRHFDVPG